MIANFVDLCQEIQVKYLKQISRFHKGPHQIYKKDLFKNISVIYFPHCQTVYNELDLIFCQPAFQSADQPCDRVVEVCAIHKKNVFSVFKAFLFIRHAFAL